MAKIAVFRQKKPKNRVFLRKKLEKSPFSWYFIKSSILGKGFLYPYWGAKDRKHGALQARLHQKDAVMEPGDSVSWRFWVFSSSDTPVRQTETCSLIIKNVRKRFGSRLFLWEEVQQETEKKERVGPSRTAETLPPGIDTAWRKKRKKADYGSKSFN